MRHFVSTRETFRWLAGGWLILCVASAPWGITAQRGAGAAAEPSVDEAMVRLAAVLTGAFGDEGAQIPSAIENLSVAMAARERRIAGLESRIATASAGDAASARIELARELAGAGRNTDAAAVLSTAAGFPTAPSAPGVLLGGVRQALGRDADAAATFRDTWNRHRGDPVAAYWFVQSASDADAGNISPALDALWAAYRDALKQKTPSRRAPFPALGTPRDVNAAPVLLPARYARVEPSVRMSDSRAVLNQLRAAAAVDPLVNDLARATASMAAGSSALRAGRLTVAREQFVLAVAAKPTSSEAHRLLGTTYWLERDLEKSAGELRRAMALRPDDERSRLMLARVLTEQRGFDAAELALQETLVAAPDSALARMSLASLLESVNRGEDAAVQYAAVAARVTATARATLCAVAARLYQNAGNLEAAHAQWLCSVRADPNEPTLHIELARSYLELERPIQAAAEYLAALLIDAGEPNAFMGIGQLQLSAGQTADAVTTFQRLVMLQPGFAEAHHALGNALLQDGRREAGARQLEQFQRLQQEAEQQKRRSLALSVMKEEALLRTASGELERAIVLWRQVVEQQPEVAGSSLALGSVLADAGQPAAALAVLERAASLGAAPEVYRRLAQVYAQLGRGPESAAARARYEAALLTPGGTAR